MAQEQVNSEYREIIWGTAERIETGKVKKKWTMNRNVKTDGQRRRRTEVQRNRRTKRQKYQGAEGIGKDKFKDRWKGIQEQNFRKYVKLALELICVTGVLKSCLLKKHTKGIINYLMLIVPFLQSTDSTFFLHLPVFSSLFILAAPFFISSWIFQLNYASPHQSS